MIPFCARRGLPLNAPNCTGDACVECMNTEELLRRLVTKLVPKHYTLFELAEITGLPRRLLKHSRSARAPLQVNELMYAKIRIVAPALLVDLHARGERLGE